MSTTYRHSGRHIPIASASGAITSGTIVAQEGFVGVAINTLASGESGWLDAAGVHYITVPATTAKGDKLYLPGTAGVATEANAPTLTKSAGAGANQFVGVAVSDIDADNKAQVLLAGQGLGNAA